MKRREFLCTGIGAAFVALTVGKAKAATPSVMTIYKDPNCGCCNLWAKSMETEGFKVERVNTDDLPGIKKRFGVPAEVEGCHTATVEGYFLDGHVPLEAVRKLLAEKPGIAGLAVPGMPAGSLGMGNDPSASYDVFAVAKGPDRKVSVYYEVRPKS
ncbi:DUF411 domain-containing protein [Phyllobacterium calauticae]|jgi:hypothetical protein|uniref:DUF411 domain-containing protein n=1 Tax=Phyllobacterium calauticae TaxID=2817027 RepID=UPI001CC081ED|nr:DUF411 domain-containing protein [Phyllobacterium calauticae]MBZ3695689.1 DUF411 domain-containing protein [Phyllobacterium calauticae]